MSAGRDDVGNAVASGRAPARVGLLGNPSDGYGGRVIAMTIPSLQARVSVEPAKAWDMAGSVLIEATIEALRSRVPELVADPARVSFTTTIPREVGLSGSSAIIMAALRALADRAGYAWDPVPLARTTLEVETDVLGWAAGPQDRVVQAYDGLVDMDFAEPWQPGRYHRLDPRLLPPLYVAWSRLPGTPSDVPHSSVRERWLEGDREVREAMIRFAELAVAGRTSLDRGTATDDWPGLLREAFTLRRRIWPIAAIDLALVDAGEALGAGVALAGSGGAVVGAVNDAGALPEAAAAYREMDAGFLVLHPAGQRDPMTPAP